MTWFQSELVVCTYAYLEDVAAFQLAMHALILRGEACENRKPVEDLTRLVNGGKGSIVLQKVQTKRSP